jgi:hypothetical protein
MDASANNQKNDQGKRGERFSTKAEVAAGPARVLANNKTNPPSSSLKKTNKSGGRHIYSRYILLLYSLEFL